MPILNEDQLNQAGWKFVEYDKLNETNKKNPIYSTIEDKSDKYLVDGDGNLVSKQKVEDWLNSYQAQLPYQEQVDKPRWHHLKNWDRLTLSDLRYDPDFTEEDATRLITSNNNIKYQTLYPEEQELPQDIKDILINDVIGRRKLAYQRMQDQEQAGKNIRYADWVIGEIYKNNLNYRNYPDYIFDMSKHKTAAALTTGDVVSKRASAPIMLTLPHEFSHVMDNIGVDLTPEQQKILEEAYGKDFDEAQGEALSNNPTYSNSYRFNTEWPTTNIDTRIQLFLHNLPNKLGQGPETQNPLLQNVDLDNVKKAVRDANVYGWYYINFLEKKYKDNPKELNKKLNNIKKAIMFVKNINKKEPSRSKNLT